MVCVLESGAVQQTPRKCSRSKERANQKHGDTDEFNYARGCNDKMFIIHDASTRHIRIEHSGYEFKAASSSPPVKTIASTGPVRGLTGYHVDGCYGEACVADARYCFPIPDAYDDVEAASMLGVGLIGYHALRMAGPAARIGLYGFGAAAHLIAQVAIFEGREVFAFTRPDDVQAQAFARSLGCVWVGSSHDPAPVVLESAILFAPDGGLVPRALRAVGRGGTVACAGIHMSDIPSFAYRDLWEERLIRSVANLTRDDAREFLAIAPQVPVRCETEVFRLSEANEALARLRAGRVTGAAVLRVDEFAR